MGLKTLLLSICLSFLIQPKPLLAQSEVTDYETEFEFYLSALERSHPSLYRYTPKMQFDSTRDSIKKILSTESIDELQYFQLLSKVESMVREIHTYVEPSDSLFSKIQGRPLFPFKVWIDDKKMVITGTDNKLYPEMIGAKITSINGNPIEQILSKIYQSTGLKTASNLSPIRRILSIDFNFAFAYHFFMDNSTRFQINYIKGGMNKTDSFQGSVHESQNHYPVMSKKQEPLYQLDLNNDLRLAILRISDFYFRKKTSEFESYETFLKETFDSLNQNNIDDLIIDVRGNKGGTDLAIKSLLSYLTRKGFNIYEYIKIKNYGLYYPGQLNVPKTKKEILKLSKKYVKTDSGCYQTKLGYYKVKPVSSLHFKGNIYVLCDGGSRSATSVFLAMVKTHKIGTIIGTESGGSLTHVDNGGKLYKLPYSLNKMGYTRHSFKIKSKGNDPKRGIIPDYQVNYSIDDIITDQDPVMKFTLDMINRN